MMSLHRICLAVLAVVPCATIAAEICAGITCRSPHLGYDGALRHPNATGNFTVDAFLFDSADAGRKVVRDGRDHDLDHEHGDDDHDDDDDDRDRDDYDDDGDEEDWTWYTRLMDVNVSETENIVHQSFELYGRLRIDRGHDGHDDIAVPRNVCAVVLQPVDKKSENEDGDCSSVFRDDKIREMEDELRSAVGRVHGRGLNKSPCGEVRGFNFDIAGDILSSNNITSDIRDRRLIAQYLFIQSSDPHSRDDAGSYIATLNKITPIFLLSYPSSLPTRSWPSGDMSDLIQTRLTCVWARDIAKGSPGPDPGPGRGDGDTGGDKGGAMRLGSGEGAKWTLILAGLGWFVSWHYF
ncbi:uncharacterized protein CIMG_04464 [Coccidioides immitis RS]|uniref:Uncharacterized protein n=4 Tax=Coccidioides immitis TaxID=5501 RepID=J3KDJ5_COCIM|nr:uncharacterized protein CIMG_04464 [Coccidioides immitis RS]EAS33440.3 hypothetical protein CIMG_04464 [Coccidioides immitis RS]KMP04606.1 hypothetical protein CIRG_04287 [Coccidioides immitis RMSCC 2394]KMU79449.1 hypothetical protein CISG_07880 [Coccidioides immitis RMSCC 3703]TPX21168.1 hypothetical protein DIZ76_015122 [Coccidioides immitis]